MGRRCKDSRRHSILMYGYDSHIAVLKELKRNDYITYDTMKEYHILSLSYDISYIRSCGIKIKEYKVNKETRYKIEL